MAGASLRSSIFSRGRGVKCYNNPEINKSITRHSHKYTVFHADFKNITLKAVRLSVDIVNEMDRQLDQKIEKRRFFQDIQNSFQWVTGIGLKMPQFFSF